MQLRSGYYLRTDNLRRLPEDIPINEQRNLVNTGLTESCQNIRPVCRYFKKGTCQYGDRCRFSHCDTSKTKPSKKEETQTASTSTENCTIVPPLYQSSPDISDWVNAPEFIPSAIKHSQKIKSYAQIVNPNSDKHDNYKICPYEMSGVCTLPEGECQYLHYEICDLCGQPALHPFNAEERKKHTQVIRNFYFPRLLHIIITYIKKNYFYKLLFILL